jgi:nitroimidazol reductase NimA-like FMN-containing flavoprotein (pyridoxamine 5'-phosphate oxidase superfamily)
MKTKRKVEAAMASPVPGEGSGKESNRERGRRISPTPRTTLRRRADRGSYDRAVIDAILDEGLVCHVGFSEGGQAFVLPASYARAGDRVLLHGSVESRMLNALRAGAPACLTVTILDGVVLARSAFRHSLNYRSVVILGKAEEVSEPGAKQAALAAIVEHIVPGRTADVRRPSDAEVAATMVLSLRIEEASAKVRRGPPVDLEEDRRLPCWAGEIPLSVVAGAPVPDAHVAAGTVVPGPVAHYRRGVAPAHRG